MSVYYYNVMNPMTTIFKIFKNCMFQTLCEARVLAKSTVAQKLLQ